MLVTVLPWLRATAYSKKYNYACCSSPLNLRGTQWTLVDDTPLGLVHSVRQPTHLGPGRVYCLYVALVVSSTMTGQCIVQSPYRTTMYYLCAAVL